MSKKKAKYKSTISPITNSASIQENPQNRVVARSRPAKIFMEFSLSLASELEKQSLEMDLFLHFQNERLRTILQEESRRLHVILLQRYESKMKTLMRQKDDELALAANRAMELQNSLVMAEMESKAWQKIAMENEAMILDLNKKLNQMRQDFHHNNGFSVEDAESVCDREDHQGGGEYNNKEKVACKVCHVRNSCLVFLPCRHLCCCKSCEGLLGFCPVCGTVKNASLEALLV